ncbi:hypothetical protein E2C01_075391 [Portunus trituberculatus]|uniref:Uncharacterized protein n=1 Tax=Portunus trituberculatus TaxID=210409 RepID=A0A5B7IJ06_PORTR|nr:hypothetical protein [Portunus trituberculatus]
MNPWPIWQLEGRGGTYRLPACVPSLPLSKYCTTLQALRPGHHNTRPAYPPGGLRRPTLLATCCPSPYLCLLEEERPATSPVIPTQDYPRAHKDPKEATKIYGSL